MCLRVVAVEVYAAKLRVLEVEESSVHYSSQITVDVALFYNQFFLSGVDVEAYNLSLCPFVHHLVFVGVQFVVHHHCACILPVVFSQCHVFHFPVVQVPCLYGVFPVSVCVEVQCLSCPRKDVGKVRLVVFPVSGLWQLAEVGLHPVVYVVVFLFVEVVEVSVLNKHILEPVVPFREVDFLYYGKFPCCQVSVVQSLYVVLYVGEEGVFRVACGAAVVFPVHAFRAWRYLLVSPYVVVAGSGVVAAAAWVVAHCACRGEQHGDSERKGQ